MRGSFDFWLFGTGNLVVLLGLVTIVHFLVQKSNFSNVSNSIEFE